MQPLSLDPSWIKIGDGSDDNAPLAKNVRRNGMVIGRVVDATDYSVKPVVKVSYDAQLFWRGDWQNVGNFDDINKAVDALGNARTISS